MIINPINIDSRTIGVMYTAPFAQRMPLFKESWKGQQPTQTTIRINIPQRYHQAPIISHLCNYYGLEVNIIAAKLSTDTGMDGCFDLQLLGTNHQIETALNYLSILDIVVSLEGKIQT